MMPEDKVKVVNMKRLNLTVRMYYLRRKRILNVMYETKGGPLCFETFQDHEKEINSRSLFRKVKGDRWARKKVKRR
jgi:hypothetical protein